MSFVHYVPASFSHCGGSMKKKQLDLDDQNLMRTSFDFASCRWDLQTTSIQLTGYDNKLRGEGASNNKE